MTLTEFLKREIAADEAVARRAQRGYQHVFGIPHYFTANSDTSVAMNPRVALAECEAKRRIVEEWHAATEAVFDEWSAGEAYGLEVAVKHFAQVFADRPGFDPAWRLDQP